MTSAAAGLHLEVHRFLLEAQGEVHSLLVRSSSVRRCCSCSRGWHPPWQQRLQLRQQQVAAALAVQRQEAMLHLQQQRVQMYQMLAAAWM
jgi:hypothetical protein